MKAYIGVAESPAGKISFAVDDAGSLIYTSFADGNYLESMEDVLEERGYGLAENTAKTNEVRTQIEAYTAGERREFTLKTSPAGTKWQMKVWNALKEIPYGETRTYGKIAAELGHPKASRAVGRANATNRIPLVVPCHRVVGSNGKLTGFAGGIHLKEKLLAHEKSVSERLSV